MQVKCKICGNQLDKKDAYCIETVSKKTGKITRKYVCDEIEYEAYIQEKQKLKKDKEDMFNIFNEILGYECIAYTLINKQLKSILDRYTYDDINYCLSDLKENIRDYMDLKDIDKEFQKIRYIITVLESNITDSSKTRKEIEIRNKQSKNKISVEEIEKEEIPYSDVNFKSQDTIDFTQLF